MLPARCLASSREPLGVAHVGGAPPTLNQLSLSSGVSAQCWGLRNKSVDCARRRIRGRPLDGGSIPPISTHPTPGFRWKPGVCLRVTAVGYELLKADSSMRMLSVTRWRLNRRLRTGRMLRRRHKLDNQGLRGNGLPTYSSAHSPSSKWCSHRGCDLSRSCNGMVHPTVNWGHFHGV